MPENNQSLAGVCWVTTAALAGVRFHTLGMARLAHSQELTSVVEGYPLAIRYREAGQK